MRLPEIEMETASRLAAAFAVASCAVSLPVIAICVVRGLMF